jgi:hypothetical protein
MSDAFKAGYNHGQSGGQIPPQGNTPATVYKEFAAGVAAARKS